MKIKKGDVVTSVNHDEKSMNNKRYYTIEVRPFEGALWVQRGSALLSFEQASKEREEWVEGYHSARIRESKAYEIKLEQREVKNEFSSGPGRD